MSLIQPDIKGYRQLSELDAALINEIKEKGEEVGQLVEKLRTLRGTCDPRWVAIGATELQVGFMALTRSVAQPTTF